MGLGGEAQYLKKEIRNWNQNGGGGGKGWVVFWIIIAIIGISSLGTYIYLTVTDDSKIDSEAIESTQETEEQNVATAGVKHNLTQEIELTDNFTFAIPEEAVESPEDVDTESGFTNERVFVWDDRKMVARCFIIPDEPECFPGLVEYFYEDSEAKPEYSAFFDTALATAKDKVNDADGNIMYHNAYFWPDGGETLCCVEVFGYNKGTRKQAKQIFESVKYKGESQATFIANNPDYLAPSDYQYDERDAMVQDIMEEEYQRAMREEAESDNWGRMY